MSYNDEDCLPLEWPNKEDYYEVMGMLYKDFDIVVKDFYENTLKNIGDSNDVEHLSITTFPSTPLPVKGYLYGPNWRLMVPLVFQLSDLPDAPILNVWCMIATDIPITFLSVQTLGALVGEENVRENGYYRISIQRTGTNYECRVSKPNFKNCNIIGMDVLRTMNATPIVNWNRRSVILKACDSVEE